MKTIKKCAANADNVEYDVTCAINGSIVADELIFPYAISRWDPKVID